MIDASDRLLTPAEVASLFRVDPKTVTRWAAAGKIGSIRTPGGHRRFREVEVRALLEGDASLVAAMQHDDTTLRSALDNSAAGNTADLGDFTRYARD